MNKTKQKILNAALNLYNQSGVSNVSIRQIALEAKISHSNLIYHYPNHEDLILGLHEILLSRALEINKEVERTSISLIELHNSTKKGFSVVFDFAFLFNDLQYICNSYPRIKELIVSIEKIRSAMYNNVINQLISQKWMRAEEFHHEYSQLINLIKIFSDHWIVSSSIYDDLTKQEKLDKYSYLLMTYFYPYLTPMGKEEFNKIQITRAKKS
ncbi:MAG: TetR/AcrR family transcriptional regulator [Saprospiraceae bacterium]